MDKEKLLIITVGGTVNNIRKSVKKWKPEKICFIVSEESKQKITEAVDMGKEKIFPKKHDCRFIIVEDPQDMNKTVKNIKNELDQEHQKWISNGDNYISIVDITGGTKCMTASLALVAQRWRDCLFSYVGGESRDKAGLGVVKGGSEQVMPSYNPWEVLGYQYIEDAVLLFDRHSYSEAYEVLDSAFKQMTQKNTTPKVQSKQDAQMVKNGTDERRKNIEQENQSPVLKEEFCTAKKWIEAYMHWDNFQHKKALNILETKVQKHLNDLKKIFEEFNFDFERNLTDSIKYLKKLSYSCNNSVDGTQNNRKNSLYLIFDLIVNAKRRKEQGRLDDAVARLYRAIEAIAQYRLWHEYDIDSSKAPVSVLQPKSQNKNSESCMKKIGLQESYLCLYNKGDFIGKKFKELGLLNSFDDDLSKSSIENNPLTQRNNSILAHGFEPISKEENFEELLEPACKLFDALKAEYHDENQSFDFEQEDKPPFFPKLEKKEKRIKTDHGR